MSSNIYKSMVLGPVVKDTMIHKILLYPRPVTVRCQTSLETDGQCAILRLAWFTEPLPDKNTEAIYLPCANSGPSSFIFEAL